MRFPVDPDLGTPLFNSINRDADDVPMLRSYVCNAGAFTEERRPVAEAHMALRIDENKCTGFAALHIFLHQLGAVQYCTLSMSTK